MKTLYGAVAAAALLTGTLAHVVAQQNTPGAPAQAAPAAAQQPEPQQNGPGAARAQRFSEGDGSTIFGNFCENCHGNPKVDSAPSPAVLKQMAPERIYLTLTTGDMATIAQALTDKQKRDIAEWVGGRKLGATESGDAKKMTNVCPANPPLRDLTSKPSWNGWSADLSLTRFQSAKAANLSPAQVSRLRLKWAFGVPAAASVYGQPTIVDGHVFVSSDAGFIYSLDAESGCVHWSFQAQTGVRSAINIGKMKPAGGQAEKYAAFFGDIHGNVYAVDAGNGELLWKHAIDAHPLSRITGGTRLYNGRLYVPVASLEEPESSSANYECCTFRGMVAALDANTGEQVWKTYTIPDKPTPRKTPDGKNFIGPSGAGVWSPVTIDPKRHAIYFVTGNTFSAPDVGRSDAIMALDLDTGKVLWVQQDEAQDIWHTGCPQGPEPAGFPPKTFRGTAGTPTPVRRLPPMPPTYYCPDPEGPDWDFSAGAILIDLPNGKSLLVAGQKSGLVWAHDPDKKGALVWRSDISRGQIVFGGAADDEKAYFAMRGGTGVIAGLAAVGLSDGVEKWFTPIPPQESMSTHAGITAGVTVIPGVVFTAGLDGMLRAFATIDGRPVWQYDTTQEVETVNGVKARGGSIGSAGTTVAGGMVYVTSGYTGFQGGSPGNMLLAFAP